MEISVFIREYAPLAGEAGRAFRIDPVVILAQAAIETGWGESTLCREYHNFFVHGLLPPASLGLSPGGRHERQPYGLRQGDRLQPLHQRGERR